MLGEDGPLVVGVKVTTCCAEGQARRGPIGAVYSDAAR